MGPEGGVRREAQAGAEHRDGPEPGGHGPAEVQLADARVTIPDLQGPVVVQPGLAALQVDLPVFDQLPGGLDAVHRVRVGQGESAPAVDKVRREAVAETETERRPPPGRRRSMGQQGSPGIQWAEERLLQWKPGRYW